MLMDLHLGGEICNPVILLKATLKNHNILQVVGCLYMKYKSFEYMILLKRYSLFEIK